jgi:hypothetical protein
VQGNAFLSPLCLCSSTLYTLSSFSTSGSAGDSRLALVHLTLVFIKGFDRARNQMRPLGPKSRHCVTSDRAQSAYPYTLPNLTIFVPEYS